MTDFGRRGQRLWENLLERDSNLADELNPDREVAISACHTADRVELMETQATFAEPVIEGRTGMQANPLYVELRQQAALLARLIAALRLPDLAAGKRPQHRQLRGVQALKDKPTGGLSSLERARQARSS